MQYKSPLSFLDIDLSNGSVDFSTINFNLLKKKYMAEFELTNSVTIATPMGEMSKNDVINFFDTIQSNKHLNFHVELLKHKTLLIFLQTNELKAFVKHEPIFDDPEFKTFLTPYIQHSYNALVCNLINTRSSTNAYYRDIPKLADVGANSDFYKPIKVCLRHKILCIQSWTESLEKSKNSVSPADLSQIFDYHMVRVLNDLDQSAFEPEIYSFMRASNLLLEAYINPRTQRFDNETTVKSILGKISQIKNRPPEVNQRLGEYIDYFNQREKTSERGSGGNVFSAIKVILLIGFIVSFIARACH